MNHEQIYTSIKKSFCDIWSFKDHGDLLEVITPFATTTDKFVSVFIKREGKYFIVTDGGWISDGEYDNQVDLNDNIFVKAFYYFKSFYGIREKVEYGSEFYFKITESKDLLPNLVHDVSNFVVSIIGASQVDFAEKKESADRRMFSSSVNAFLSSFVPDGNLVRNKPIGEHIKDVHFNAIVTVNKRINLVKYITGTNITNLRNSISRASNDFYAANRSIYKGNIGNMVSFINDSSDAYKPSEVYTYLDNLSAISGIEPIVWSQKEKALPFLN